MFLSLIEKQLNYDEDEEQASDPKRHEKRSNDANQHDNDEQYQDCITFAKEVRCHHPELFCVGDLSAAILITVPNYSLVNVQSFLSL